MKAKTNKPKVLAGLSDEAKQFWVELRTEYTIHDCAGLKYVGRACEALDRLRGAQRIIKREGEIISDKKGSVKAHPAIAIEKEAHRQLMEALRALNLDIEPPAKKLGRPSGFGG